MSYKIRNGNTSNCGTNPRAAAGDGAGVTVSITRKPARDPRETRAGIAALGAAAAALPGNMCV